jgi:hypothetical protein
MIDLSEDNFHIEYNYSNLMEEILKNFVCVICYGVVVNRMKCGKCE